MFPAPTGRIHSVQPSASPQLRQRTLTPAHNSTHGPALKMLPTYEWKLPLSTPPFPLSRTPTLSSGRKRQNEECSPQITKRQCLESTSQLRIIVPCTPTAPSLPAPNQSVAVTPNTYVPGYCGLRPQPSPQPHVPINPPRDNLLTYAKDKLSGQLVDLFEACQQQITDLTRKERCRTWLQQDIQTVFPLARLYLTGSSMNGLGCRSSDADLCLVVNRYQRPDPYSLLYFLRGFFRSLSYVEQIQLIRAKVPILRFREKGSDLEFDMNINNTVGIRNTFLLRSYAYADLRIRPIVLAVKKWAKYHHINDASQGTLSSYALVLMVLHYLQTLKEPVLPSLQKDYPECFNPLMDIDMVPDGPKYIPPYNSKNQSSLGDLFLGFLKYYATEFRWDKHVISVQEGSALPKNNSPEWNNKCICVEEPFEKKNVARAVHQLVKFDAIKAQFAESFKILQQRKDLNSILPVRAIMNKESSRK
ncbi:poly(A) RNA polymerase GLD2 isoform X2 [Thalassophryne amazonica]|uniref:poly(A) RNA polymerase GLD2 isoform X2 n=1 Tax=Thalassophryne amazonica TaxID=390379 RepID=UPI001471547F|nr:poly(A) RNA polymerase GLD2 isoform X2 [Thalassophryne amazonica]